MRHEAECLHDLDALVPSREDTNGQLDRVIRQRLEDVSAEGTKHGCSSADCRAEEGGFGAEIGWCMEDGVEMPEKGPEVGEVAVARGVSSRKREKEARAQIKKAFKVWERKETEIDGVKGQVRVRVNWVQVGEIGRAHV